MSCNPPVMEMPGTLAALAALLVFSVPARSQEPFAERSPGAGISRASGVSYVDTTGRAGDRIGYDVAPFERNLDRLLPRPAGESHRVLRPLAAGALVLLTVAALTSDEVRSILPSGHPVVGNVMIGAFFMTIGAMISK